MSSATDITIKRIYDEPSDDDGYRILVDRLWPRGVGKEEARVDEWNRTIAPSTTLRKWFDHKEQRFEEFSERYLKELSLHRDELLRIRKVAETKRVTLVYGAKDRTANHAVVLCGALKDEDA